MIVIVIDDDVDGEGDCDSGLIGIGNNGQFKPKPKVTNYNRTIIWLIPYIVYHQLFDNQKINPMPHLPFLQIINILRQLVTPFFSSLKSQIIFDFLKRNVFFV